MALTPCRAIYKISLNPPIVMKIYQPMAVVAAVSTIALVSCDQADRVVERPLPGYNGAPYTPDVPSVNVNPSTGQNDLLNQLQDPSSIGIDGNNLAGGNPATPGVDPGSGTVGRLLGNSGSSLTPPATGNSGGISSPSITPTVPTVKTPVQPNHVPSVPNTVTPPKTDNGIPTAWPTEDPMVVRSPYDSSKKIRIQKPDGTRYASGTVMRDTNFPNEVRKFRVP